MRKTLRCLVIGIACFYLGIFAQGLIYWEKMDANVELVNDEIPTVSVPETADIIEASNKETPEKPLYIPLENITSWGFYYNLPTSKGRHAPDFYWEGSFFVRKHPSRIELESFGFVSVNYDKRKFSFETKEIRGVKYTMTGILPNEKNSFNIKGILKKYRKGVLQDKRKVIFQPAIPTC